MVKREKSKKIRGKKEPETLNAIRELNKKPG
jgi:hypothetical protein